jgi:hypothetical protein
MAACVSMSLNCDENQTLSNQDLVCILAIAGRIDAQEKIIKAQEKSFASQLHNNRLVYYGYSVLDSLSSSYSMFKYFFDMVSGGSADQMHDLMLNPAVMAGIALESSFLVCYSFLACYFDDLPSTNDEQKEKNPYERFKDNLKQFVIDSWPYFRDIMKGFKNAYKGWRSFSIAMQLMGIVNLNFLIIPLGIVLGVLAALNRCVIQRVREARKIMMSKNISLLRELSKLSSPTEIEDAQSDLQKIQSQSTNERMLGFVCSFFGGLIDGLYQYAGVLTLAFFFPALMIALSVFCALYTLSCIVTRIHEEYDYQLKLEVTQTQCQLVALTKLIQTRYAKLLYLSTKEHLTAEEQLTLEKLKEDLSQYIEQFSKKRTLLIQQSSPSYVSAALNGLRNGLCVYGAVSSILFLVSNILALAGVAFPPIAIAAVVFTGALLIAGFIIESIVRQHNHTKATLNKNDSLEPKENQTTYFDLLNLGLNFKDVKAKTTLLKADNINQALKEGLSVAEQPVSLYQQWSEVFRSLFSGLGKGQKFSDFAANPLQEMGGDGHYHDSPIMLVLNSLSALLFGPVLALRALAKGLGKVQLGNSTPLSAAVLPLTNLDEIEIEIKSSSSSDADETETNDLPDDVPQELPENKALPPTPRTPKKSKAPKTLNLEELSQRRQSSDQILQTPTEIKTPRVSFIGIFSERNKKSMTRIASGRALSSLIDQTDEAGATCDSEPRIAVG